MVVAPSLTCSVKIKQTPGKLFVQTNAIILTNKQIENNIFHCEYSWCYNQPHTAYPERLQLLGC